MTLVSSFLAGLPAEVENDPARTRLLLGELLTRGAPGVQEAIQNGLSAPEAGTVPLRLKAESIDQVTRLVRESFGRAITRIYFFTWFFVAGGVLITVFVPELKLRET
jgi:hypothetical protein